MLLAVVLQSSIVASPAAGVVGGMNVGKAQTYTTEASNSEPTTVVLPGLSPLHIVGNSFVNEAGVKVVLHGIDIWNQRIELDGPARPLNQADFGYLANSWNVKVVRIPIFPPTWATGQDNLTFLEKQVSWANQYGMYAIIDWHAVGDIASPNGWNVPSLAFTEAFWSTISQAFRGKPGVMYEIYNEPSQITWNQWQGYAQQIVTLIREYDPNTIILVSGVRSSSDLSGVRGQPVSGTNIGYVVHPYPNSCSYFDESGSTCWDSAFGNTSAVYPVFATEWGYYTRDQSLCASEFSTLNFNGYAGKLLAYLQAKEISWSAWVWNPYGCPTMLLSWLKYQPTQYGQFVQAALTSESSPTAVSPLVALFRPSVSAYGTMTVVPPGRSQNPDGWSKQSR